MIYMIVYKNHICFNLPAFLHSFEELHREIFSSKYTLVLCHSQNQTFTQYRLFCQCSKKSVLVLIKRKSSRCNNMARLQLKCLKFLCYVKWSQKLTTDEVSYHNDSYPLRFNKGGTGLDLEFRVMMHMYVRSYQVVCYSTEISVVAQESF